MAYGLIVNNLYGKTLIDGQFKNMIRHWADDEPKTDVSSVSAVFFSPIPIASGTPLTSIKLNSNYMAVTGLTIDGTPAWSGAVIKRVTGGGNWTLYYNVFKTAPNDLTIPNYGLVVYNHDGDLVFSSDEEYLQIINVYTGSQAYDDGPDIHTVVNADDNYFVLLPHTVGIYYSGANRYIRFRGMKRVDATTVSVGTFEISQVLGGSGSDWFRWTDDYTMLEVRPILYPR